MRLDIQRWLVLATAILGLQACRAPAPIDSASMPDPAAVATTATDTRAVDAAPDTVSPEATSTPVPEVDVWDALRAGFALTDDLPLGQPRFARALAWVTKQSDLLSDMEPRAQRYLPYLVQQVAKRNLPLEIALLPVVESTLDPYAASAQGAAGLWQLIPGTARRYGVSINWWYDGRRDLVDSTDAALDYLEALHAELGDWLLVLAAYNCGERRILRALSRHPDATFWDIDLPKETAGYVPRLLALAALIRTPEAFGAKLPAVEVDPVFGVSELEEQIDLATVARKANIPLDEIFRLNPGLNHSATPPEGPHRLLLPIADLDAFEAALGEYTTNTPRWTSYKVRDGDTLGAIASRHNTTVGAIREANSLKGHLIHVGDTLLIPTSRVSAKLAANPLLRSTRYTTYYRVASGDSLWSISRRLGVTVGALARANQLDPRATLAIGQRLSVPGRIRVASR